MKIEDFELELQTIHKDFTIRKNRNIETIANIYFQGAELIPVPYPDIYDTKRSDYCWIDPSGGEHPHRSRPDAINIARGLAERMLSDQDYSDAMKGEGEYSDSALEIGAHKPSMKLNLTPLADEPVSEAHV